MWHFRKTSRSWNVSNTKRTRQFRYDNGLSSNSFNRKYINALTVGGKVSRFRKGLVDTRILTHSSKKKHLWIISWRKVQHLFLNYSRLDGQFVIVHQRRTSGWVSQGYYNYTYKCGERVTITIHSNVQTPWFVWFLFFSSFFVFFLNAISTVPLVVAWLKKKKSCINTDWLQEDSSKILPALIFFWNVLWKIISK